MPAPHASPSPVDLALTVDRDEATDRSKDSLASTNRYELSDEIARGGMGVVLRAIDTVLEREVAVKVLQDKFTATSSAARRFGDEARITARLQHPAIPPVHDLGTLPDGRSFLAMKLIRGRTLDELLRERPDPTHDRGRFVAVFEQVCQAIAYAHNRGVIHRDLKPANIMVGTFGEVQVMDWGLAKELDRQTATAPHTGAPGDASPNVDPERTTLHQAGDGSTDDRTHAGQVMGTPAYMPPEQARGEIDRVDRRSDVFALGGILCVVLTGRAPYGGTGEARRLAAAGDLSDALARLDACNADSELVALCRRCLSPNPADRPADGGDAARLAAAYRAGVEDRLRQAEAARAAAAAKAIEQRKRRKVQVALAGSIAVLVFGAGLAAWWADRQSRERTDLNRRQQLEEQQRAVVEQARTTRNADAIGVLLDQAESALRAGDAVNAALALDAAEKRAAEGGVDHLLDRLQRLRDDLIVLKAVVDADRFRWTQATTLMPDRTESIAQLKAALAQFGADSESVSPDEAARRVMNSTVKDRLLGTLDRLLVMTQSAAVRATLKIVDPHPLRDRVRDSALAGQGARVTDLFSIKEIAEQPPGFAAVVGDDGTVPIARRREWLRAAVERWPNDLILLMSLATSYPNNLSDGDDERLRWYQAAVAVAPTNSAAHNNMGVALLERGDIAGAEAACRTATRLAPNDPFAFNNLGNSLATKHDPIGAEAAYREAVRLAPKSPVAHSSLGGLLVAKGDVVGAEAECRKAIALDPNSAVAFANLGVALLERKDLAGAEAAQREALRLAPTYAPAHQGLANVLHDRGDRVGAEAEYREAIRLNPRFSGAYFNLGVVLRENNKVAEAEACHRNALRYNPMHIAAHNSLGIILRDRGDHAGAVLEFQEALRINPKYSFAHNNLGIAYAIRGNLDAAIASFEEAINCDPTNNGARSNLDKALQMKAAGKGKKEPVGKEK